MHETMIMGLSILCIIAIYNMVMAECERRVKIKEQFERAEEEERVLLEGRSIPKMVVNPQYIQGAYYASSGTCPSCGRSVDGYMQRCESCRQELLWVK